MKLTLVFCTACSICTVVVPNLISLVSRLSLVFAMIVTAYHGMPVMIFIEEFIHFKSIHT